MISTAVYTLYSQNQEKYFTDNNLSLLYLSVLYSKKIFKKIILSCDDIAFYYLIEKLKMPFDEVYLWQNNFPHRYQHIWSLSKMITCAKMNEPFCHIDNDVVLHSKLPNKVLNGEIIGQSGYVAPLFSYYQNMAYLPEAINNNLVDDVICSNAGLMGGNDLEFFKKLTPISLDLVTHKDNLNYFTNTNFNLSLHNVFPDEHCIGLWAKINNIKIINLFSNLGYPSEDEAVKLGYTHLAGHYKHDPANIIKVKKRLVKEDAFLYSEIRKVSFTH